MAQTLTESECLCETSQSSCAVGCERLWNFLEGTTKPPPLLSRVLSSLAEIASLTLWSKQLCHPAKTWTWLSAKGLVGGWILSSALGSPGLIHASGLQLFGLTRSVTSSLHWTTETMLQPSGQQEATLDCCLPSGNRDDWYVTWWNCYIIYILYTITYHSCEAVKCCIQEQQIKKCTNSDNSLHKGTVPGGLHFVEQHEWLMNCFNCPSRVK